jgi:hypothetical protein
MEKKKYSLSLYDVRGIQEFIFSSSKLKENIGASILVAKVLDEYLKKAINRLKHGISNWEDAEEFKIVNDDNIDAEVIYIGGGNAMVACRNKEIAKKVTQVLSRLVLEKTGGTLRFTVAHIDTEGDFAQDREKLMQILRQNKKSIVETSPLLGIAITKQGVTDGLPAAVKIERDEYISLPAYLKRKEEEKERHYFDYLLEGVTEYYKFPLEFDNLGHRMGERHLAVVHIDGNNMGKMIEETIKNKDYLEAVQKIRKLSKEISTHYKNVAKSVVGKIIENLKGENLKERLELKWDVEDKRLFLPFRPLVLNGDDVTFVCDGRLGIALAEEFLKGISNCSVNGHKLSACAGVAIVKAHFPFYRAYQLAEALCASAKLKGKILVNDSRKMQESWLDFHIVYSGITTEIRELRKVQYNIPGMDEAKSLKIKEHGNVLIKYDQFNLLWRPWCVEGECEDKYKWEKFKEIFNKMMMGWSQSKERGLKNASIMEKEEVKKRKDSWPRSKLKNLRDAFIKGKEEVEFYVKFCKSRGAELPDFCGGNGEIFYDNQTPYFDVLELVDFYIPLEEK